MVGITDCNRKVCNLEEVLLKEGLQEQYQGFLILCDFSGFEVSRIFVSACTNCDEPWPTVVFPVIFTSSQ
jgi:hypothetical protein